jgi:hypothetical protein
VDARGRARAGQAAYGCTWWDAWRAEVRKAEALGQTAIVVYKKGFTGWVGGWLGGWSRFFFFVFCCCWVSFEEEERKKVRSTAMQSD